MSGDCNCALTEWTIPSITDVTVAIGSTNSYELPVPTEDTSARLKTDLATCYANDGGTCAVTGSFPAATVLYEDNLASGKDLPSWMEYETTGVKVQTIKI